MMRNTKQMLLHAHDHGYAIAAFNVENAEMVQAVLAAAERSCAPVILQTTPSTLKYMPPHYFGAMVRAAAEKMTVPVALHLDHGNSLELVADCLAAGYTSVMFDGSALPFAQNILMTAQAAAMAHQAGACCEGELGCIGGKEDSLVGRDDAYTDPEEAAAFAQRTRVDSLAVAIGTAHGVYAKEPVLDLARIPFLQQAAQVPLVLHGASGLSDSVLRSAVARGMAKVNFATELRQAFSAGVREVFAVQPDVFDPKKYLSVGRKKVLATAEKKIKVCGALEQAKNG